MLSSHAQNLVRKVEIRGGPAEQVRHLLQQQWLVTNGLGGYASGTISGAVTWRYHGLLIAALPAPLGRTLMLNHLSESLCLHHEQPVQFGGAAAPEEKEDIQRLLDRNIGIGDIRLLDLPFAKARTQFEF